MSSENADDNQSPSPNVQLASFAAGCFWSIQLHFQRLPGVLHTRVGYINGKIKAPTYEKVCAGQTGFAEAVEIEFDANLISYLDLLKTLWSIHDATILNRTAQYRSGIYFHTEEQRQEAIASRIKRGKRMRWNLGAQVRGRTKITTEVVQAQEFYPAEEVHQRYLEKGGHCSAIGCSDKIE